LKPKEKPQINGTTGKDPGQPTGDDGRAVRDRLKPGFDAVETRGVAVKWELQRSAAGSAEFFQRIPAQYKSRSVASVPRNRPRSCMTCGNSGQTAISRQRREPYRDQQRVFGGARHAAAGLVVRSVV